MKALVVLLGVGYMSVAQLLQNACQIWKKKKHSGNTNHLVDMPLKCNYAAPSAATAANRFTFEIWRT